MLTKIKKGAIALLCIIVVIFVKSLVVDAKNVTSSYQEHSAKENIKSAMQKNCGGKIDTKIDGVTSVNSCDYDIDKNAFIFNYDVAVNYNDVAPTFSDAEKIKSEAVMKIKNSTHANTYIKNNISLVYNYYSLDRKLITSIFISPSELK
ncbi:MULTISPECIES: hypothetical protein [Enterobacterales]|uniref:hypothetical protein n=1 Tax=Enterobacterales TaxID=91347 RepID=UPI002EDAD4AD